MKIIFICGGLEPGRDGVGDYTRILAAETARQGHSCKLVALNDKLIKTIQAVEEEAISVIRMPEKLSWEERFVLLKKITDEFRPDWFSLQYVAFAFDDKGLPIRFASRLKNISGSVKWHIMFHELWVGMARESSSKEVLWGSAQKHLTRYLLKVLDPDVVHTHTGLYRGHLSKLGVKCILLPLPTNLPVIFPEIIAEKMKNWNLEGRGIDLILFGGIHEGAPVKQFAAEAMEYQEKEGVKLNLLVIGKKGEAQEEWTRTWKSSGLKYTLLGQLSNEEVSKILTSVFLGVFTTPLALVEKSSAVATMWAHGVNLLCVSRPWHPKSSKKVADNPYRFMEYEKGNLSEFLKAKPDFSYLPVLEDVAKQFIDHLINGKSHG